MNNQEAIRLIRNLPTMCGFTDAYGEPIDSDAYYEAVDMAISALQAQDEEQREEPLYCDRDICLHNEYNGIGCEDCEVTKSQQRAKDVKPVNSQITKITKHQSDFSDLNEDRESCENGYNRLDLSKVKFKPEPTPTEEALADVEPMFDVSEQSEDGDELDEVMQHWIKQADEQEKVAEMYPEYADECKKISNDFRQLASWLRELKERRERDERTDNCPLVELPKGEWLRMSDLSEKDDDRYKCSHCGNVIHYKSRMDLYTFNSWCGRCGSDNSRHTTIIEANKLEEDAPTVIEAKDE